MIYKQNGINELVDDTFCSFNGRWNNYDFNRFNYKDKMIPHISPISTVACIGFLIFILYLFIFAAIFRLCNVPNHNEI